MNVVGKVGSLITQGVYSVATPFHPFGGAVDVIVVQQQDGTFRSTPWYVRFGKFQGVLKGAEKIVRINVNGIEANFHMFLDNSGEAYFIQEVESGKGNETNGVLKDFDGVDVKHENGGVDHNNIDSKNEFCRLDHSVSDSGVAQLREEIDSSGAARLERAESDGDRRYYEFQDEQSSLEDSVELPEFGSNRYGSLDGEHIEESQGSDSEVILVSVDGHVLTAPVLASEQNTENVQLSTPRFHLGPGEPTEEFNSGDDGWAADYISKLKTSASNVVPDNTCNVNNDANAFEHQLEVCEGDGEHVCENKKPKDIPGLEGDLVIQSDSEDASAKSKREEVFKSCLALPELVEQVENADFEEMDCSLEVQKSFKESPLSPPAVNQTENGDLVEFTNNGLSPPPCNSDSTGLNGSPASQVEVEAIEKNALGTENIGSDSINALETEHIGSHSVSVHSVSISNDSEQKDEELRISTAIEGLASSLQRPLPEDHCSESEIVEPQRAASSEEIQSCSGISKELP